MNLNTLRTQLIETVREDREHLTIRRAVEAVVLLAIPIVFLSAPVVVKGDSLAAFYVSLFNATFGSASGWVSTLVKATPILIAGLGVLLAFRTGFWNIGAEGQMAVGAFVGSAVAFSGSTLPGPVLVLVIFVVAATAGGLYGVIAGWLKVRYEVNEILTTLMLNFIALLLVDYGAKTLWASDLGYPFSSKVPSNLRLPTLVSDLHVGVLLAFALIPAVGILLYRTDLGFELRAVGADADAARNSGMNVQRATLAVIFLSGGLAGLAGAIELIGVVGRLQQGITGPNYGYIAIVTSLIAGHRLRYLPVAALFLGGLLAANVALQVSLGGGSELLIIGLLLVSVIAFNR